MLYNDTERELMANAIQEGLKNSNIAIYDATGSIVDSYFKHIDFHGLRILDIGPGQCDFLDIVKEKGAITFGVDFDPAVVKLGEMRGHNMTLCNLREDWPFKDMKFDGIFCRSSINCYWFVQPDSNNPLQQFLDHVTKSLKPTGWMWIMPWNKPADNQKNLVDATRAVIAKWAKESKVRIEVIGKEVVNKKGRSGYEIFYDPKLLNEIWTKNCGLAVEQDLIKTNHQAIENQQSKTKPFFLYSIYKACRKRVFAWKPSPAKSIKLSNVQGVLDDFFFTLRQLIKDERWVEVDAMLATPSRFDKIVLEISLAGYKANTKIGNAKIAEYWLDRALPLLSSNPTLQRDKGVFHQKRQEWGEASLYFERACNLRPDVASYHGSLGYARHQLGNYKGAVEAYRVGLAIDKNHRAWWIHLARGQIQLNMLQDAVESYEKALALQEDVQIRNIYNELLLQVQSGSKEASVVYYDAVFAHSHKYAQSGENCEYISIWQRIVNILYDNGSTSILDLGCGPGQFAEFIAAHMPEVRYTGLDSSSVAISQASRRCPNYLFKKMKLPTTNFLGLPAFDSVVCTEVLEHVENDREILSVIPIGTLIVASVPNFDSFGHVRLFRNKEEVMERYGPLIDDIQVQAIALTPQNTLWLMYGKRFGQAIEVGNSEYTIQPQFSQIDLGASKSALLEDELYQESTSLMANSSIPMKDPLFASRTFLAQNPLSLSQGLLPFEYIQSFYEMLLESGMVNFLDYNDLQFSSDQDIQNEEGLSVLFEDEYRLWRKNHLSDISSSKLNLLIQHDSDSGPKETEYLCRFEGELGIKSTTAIFCRTINENNIVSSYDINYALLKCLQDEKDMCFAYHCNAGELASYDEAKIANVFNEDVEFLHSQGFNIRFFSPHGGIPNSSGRNNNSFFYPSFSRHRLIWTHNKFAPKGARYSDGGGVARLKRADVNIDLKKFLITKLSTGHRPLAERYFLLLHPQYYFAKNSKVAEPYFSDNPWLEEFWELYSQKRTAEYWKPVSDLLRSSLNEPKNHIMNRRYVIFNHGLRKLQGLEQFLDAEIVRAFFFAPKQIDATLGWGRKKYSKRAKQVAALRRLDYYCLEDGFLRSVGLGASEPPLSIVVDDLGIYYDATTSSRLEQLVTRVLSPAESSRANSIIDNWRKSRISKYNHLREYTGILPSRYVLVADQTLGDDSIRFGLATKQSFNHMLDAALAENPDCTILIKVHPEVMAGRKLGHFNISKLSRDPRIQILSVDVHPVRLIEHAEAIYVVTSQIGFEGLLWGKKVCTFGMPFYAGWSLTQDVLPRPERRTPVLLENLVHAALVDYPRYIDPETGRRCEPERLIKWMGLQRSMFERFPEFVYAVGFSRWKMPIVVDFFQGTSVKFVNQINETHNGSTILVWGRKDLNQYIKPSLLEDMETETNKNMKYTVIRLEDGFLRSVGLGADLIRPLSWVIDRGGIYYDATTQSDLEYLLQTTLFTAEMLDRAKELRTKIVAQNLTKYNVGESPWHRPNGTECVILVPGQVESDASIAFGSPIVYKNIDLLRAVRKANPNAYLVYKPHPDVVERLRNQGVDEDQAIEWCDEIVTSCPMAEMLMVIDEVHVMTSLAGFEALLRGKKVVTYGQPFYSSWGLSEDYCPVARRTRNLSLDELVAGALILYPTYLSRTTGKYTTPEGALEELLAWQRIGTSIISWWRKLLRPLLRINNG